MDFWKRRKWQQVGRQKGVKKEKETELERKSSGFHLESSLSGWAGI